MSRARNTALASKRPGESRNPYVNERSIEFGFRARRFFEVRRLIQSILDERGRAEILDLGGTEDYWLIGKDFVRENRSRLRITLVNTVPQRVSDTGLFASETVSASSSALHGAGRFDLVHSNSVIEHLGGWPDMRDFAANVRRLAPRYYVQTPNYWFAYEPHFRFVGFQYLPESVRVRLIMTMPLGFFAKIETLEEARSIIETHRLLSTRQMRTLFPDARVFHEKVLGLSKSIIAVRDRAAS